MWVNIPYMDGMVRSLAPWSFDSEKKIDPRIQLAYGFPQKSVPLKKTKNLLLMAEILHHRLDVKKTCK